MIAAPKLAENSRRRWEYGAAVLLVLALVAVLGGYLHRLQLNRRLAAELTWTEGKDYKQSLAAIRELTRRGGDINTCGADGATPLIWAARTGDRECVTDLVRRGARVNARDANGETALFGAALTSADLTRLLLRHGADVRARDTMGRTALHSAANSGKRAPEVIRELLAAGADPNARSVDGTAIHGAVVIGSSACIDTLLDGGADVEARDHRGQTPLIESIAYRDLLVSAALLKHGAKVNARGAAGETALSEAASALQVEMVALLLAHGADVNVPVGSEGISALKLMETTRYTPGPMESRRLRIIQLLTRHSGRRHRVVPKALRHPLTV